jgi:hypothetical protein
MRRIQLAMLLLGPVFAACDHDQPTAINPVAPQAGSLALGGATSALVDFGPIPVAFTVASPCLDGTVLVSGSFSGWDRIVTRPDGSIHITERIDVSNVTLRLGDQLWTAGPNASEIFVKNFPPGLGFGDIRQAEHVGVVIFRADDGRPELRFVHRIHIVRLPSGEVQVNRQILDVLCIAQNR